MQKLVLYFLLSFIPITYNSYQTYIEPISLFSEGDGLYSELGLENLISFPAFTQAIAGYEKIDSPNKNIVTIIDFTKPSTEERMCVIDLTKKEVLYYTHVAHGKNSGWNYATDFSNETGSYKSSLGFFLTGSTYQGKNGYSLLLEGLEKDINHRAQERAIVIHGAAYANPTVITGSGRLGRSQGCPALPPSLNQPIVNTIKGGSLVYIYAGNDEYLQKSPILNS